jgi:hypothetical protein
MTGWFLTILTHSLMSAGCMARWRKFIDAPKRA